MTTRTVSLWLALIAVSGCLSDDAPSGGSSDGSGGATTQSTAMSTSTSGPSTQGTSSTTDEPETTSTTTSASTSEASSSESSSTGAPVVPCPATAFCEDFEDYTETALADGQEFGPWRASLSDSGATMDLDGTYTVSGDAALHVRLEQGGESGGRLFTNDGVELLADSPSHLYGRMMMYIAENGTSVHWTFFGVQGEAEPASPLAGNYAAYIMSSLPRDGTNTYSFVDGLSGGPVYQDCSTQGETPMPTGEWTCIAFEMDSIARRLRMYKDGDPEPIVSVDDHGNGCVPPTPSDATWWGPLVNEMFVGTWSFHPMNDALDVWIDDLVVDTMPVACP